MENKIFPNTLLQKSASKHNPYLFNQISSYKKSQIRSGLLGSLETQRKLLRKLRKQENKEINE